MISGENKRDKAPARRLGAINEVGICSLRFKGFKLRNTLRGMQIYFQLKIEQTLNV